MGAPVGNKNAAGPHKRGSAATRLMKGRGKTHFFMGSDGKAQFYGPTVKMGKKTFKSGHVKGMKRLK